MINKKIIFIIALMVVICSITSCGKDDTNKSANKNATTVAKESTTPKNNERGIPNSFTINEASKDNSQGNNYIGELNINKNRLNLKGNIKINDSMGDGTLVVDELDLEIAKECTFTIENSSSFLNRSKKEFVKYLNSENYHTPMYYTIIVDNKKVYQVQLSD